jgi:hypothetical protein
MGTKMQEQKREPGWYWVRTHDDKVEIAKYDPHGWPCGGEWSVNGNETGTPEEAFAAIHPVRLEPPDGF